jgi:hypothetical protein
LRERTPVPPVLQCASQVLPGKVARRAVTFRGRTHRHRQKWTQTQYRNRLADSLPSGSGNLYVHPGRQWLLIAHWLRALELSQRSVKYLFQETPVADRLQTLTFVARNCHLCPIYLQPFLALTSFNSATFALSAIPTFWKIWTFDLTDSEGIPSLARVKYPAGTPLAQITVGFSLSRHDRCGRRADRRRSLRIVNVGRAVDLFDLRWKMSYPACYRLRRN